LTRKRIKEVIQNIKEDMEFDGDEVEIGLEDDLLINQEVMKFACAVR
jgi:hypothetical protein